MPGWNTDPDAYAGGYPDTHADRNTDTDASGNPDADTSDTNADTSNPDTEAIADTEVTAYAVPAANASLIGTRRGRSVKK